MSILLFLLIWIILIFLNAPVFLSLTISSSLYLLAGDEALLMIPQRLAGAADSFPLLAAPFFIFTGNLMNQSGITDRVFKFADTLTGRIRGGMGHANILGSLIFSGMSGAAVADAGGLGAVEMKAMQDRGYDPGFSAGITAASSIIGPIIPPSVPMVFYGVLSGASIGGLFIAGLLPGILIAGSLMIMVAWKVKGVPPRSSAGMGTIGVAFREAFLSLLTPVILIGGILSGLFTPTEAAFVSSLYALFLGIMVYRTLGLADIASIVIQTVEVTAVVMALVMGASLFGMILTRAQVPQAAAEFLLSFVSSKALVLFIINLLLLFTGCFMETLAAMIILLPVLLPVVKGLDMNLIQFGVVMILNLMIGTLTPPVGIVLFVVSRISGLNYKDVVVATMPFLFPLLIVLLLITYIPELTLWLPGIILGVR